MTRQPKLHVEIGIPGSGKSTHAAELAKQLNCEVVCRDDIRMELYFKYEGLDKAQEKMVKATSRERIRKALNAGKDVICDDTNLKTLSEMRHIANECGAVVEIHWALDSFNVDKCHKRNQKRGRVVPWNVIELMYLDFYRTHLEENGLPFPYVKTHLPKAIVCDLDGTAAHMNGKRGPFEWTKVGVDDPDVEVLRIVREFSRDHRVVFLSGRDGVCRPETIEWLEKHYAERNGYVTDWVLFMRTPNDQRSDYIVKRELYDKYVFNSFNTRFVLDDRMQVARQWRAMGLKVAQMDHGLF